MIFAIIVLQKVSKTKRHISILFLLTLLSLPFFFVIIQQARQLHIQHIAKHRLEVKTLHTLVLRKIEWVKKGKEIKVDGKLFDVKNIEKINGQLRVTGLFDYEETAIENYLQRQSEGAQSSSFIRFLLWAQSLFCIKWCFFDLLFFNRNMPFFITAQTIYINPFFPVLTPPPL